MKDSQKIKKTEQEWKEQLTAEQYHICRQKGTEPAFTGKYYQTQTNGQYHCVCCEKPLFHSAHKYDSGSGWPSFWKPTEPEAVRTEADYQLMMPRVEVLCSRCDSHLGHVFEDGPAPTGKRFCINSTSISLIPEH